MAISINPTLWPDPAPLDAGWDDEMWEGRRGPIDGATAVAWARRDGQERGMMWTDQHVKEEAEAFLRREEANAWALWEQRLTRAIESQNVVGVAAMLVARRMSRADPPSSKTLNDVLVTQESWLAMSPLEKVVDRRRRLMMWVLLLNAGVAPSEHAWEHGMVVLGEAGFRHLVNYGHTLLTVQVTVQATPSHDVDDVDAAVEAFRQGIVHRWLGRTDVPFSSEVLASCREQGWDIEGADKSGRTALQAAIFYNCQDWCEGLLRLGASPNATNAHGWSALHLAIYRNNVGAIEACLKAGATIDEKISGETVKWVSTIGLPTITAPSQMVMADQAPGFFSPAMVKGATIMAMACMRASHRTCATLDLLNAHGGDLHRFSDAGYGMLHIAAIALNPAAIAWGLAQGMDPWHRTIEGATALDLLMADPVDVNTGLALTQTKPRPKLNGGGRAEIQALLEQAMLRQDLKSQTEDESADLPQKSQRGVRL